MKKGLTYSYRMNSHSNGRHTHYFLMTIATAYLLAIGMLVLSFGIGKQFFNW
jgi:hypothetical protein